MRRKETESLAARGEYLTSNTCHHRWLANQREKMPKRGRAEDLVTVSEHHFDSVDHPHHLSVSIYEVMQEDYGLYVWPCSVVLAEYIWQNQSRFAGVGVLELGAGTGLPGIVAAKVGAVVTLTDREDQPQVFENMKRTCDLNQVNCQMEGLTWGQWDATAFTLRQRAQIVLGADVLYESKDFDDLFATVKFLLLGDPHGVFITTYQRRSGHRSIEFLLEKWGLQVVSLIDPSDFLSPSKLSSLSVSIEVIELRVRGSGVKVDV